MTTAVRDVMTEGLQTLGPDTSIADAAMAMRDADIGDVLVVRDGHLEGIATDRDIVVRGIAAGKDPQNTPITDVCSSEVITVHPGDSVDDAIECMRESSIRRVPVVDDDHTPVGLVSLGDLAVYLDRESVLGDVSAAPPNN